MGDRYAPYVSERLETDALMLLASGHVQLDYCDGVNTFAAWVTSKTDPGERYYTQHLPGRGWRCPCRSSRACWHIVVCRRIFTPEEDREFAGPPDRPAGKGGGMPLGPYQPGDRRRQT